MEVERRVCKRISRKLLLAELTVNEPSNRGRNILSIVLSIIVLLLISSLIVAAIVIINPEITNLTLSQHKVREAITLEEALLGELSPNDFNSHWLPPNRPDGAANANDDHLMYEDAKTLYLVTLPHSRNLNENENNNNSSQFVATSAFKPNVTVLVSNSSLLASIDYQGVKLSPSKRFLLIWTARKKQFRHSYTAKYFLYDIKLDLISLISTKPQDQQATLATGRFDSGNLSSSSSSSGHNHYDQLDAASFYLNDQPSLANDDAFVRFQLVDWFASSASPAHTQTEPLDSLILVQNNDIYTLPNVAALSSSANLQPDSPPSLPIRLTYSGKANELFNGVPDWLYEEEILSDVAAFQVSPSAKYLAYMSFNDSLVGSMPYSIYADQILPRIQRIKYPKTGQPNPTVAVHVIENLASITSRQHEQQQQLEVRDIRLRLPADLEAQQHYINRINWLSSERLALIWSNRNQNESYILICSKNGADSSWECVKSLHLAATNGWIDIGDDLLALDDHHYLALLPKFEGPEVGHFKHVAKVSLSKPNELVYLTSGRKDVNSIDGIDRQKSLFYYTSSVIGEPGQRQVFAASLNSPPVSSAERLLPIGSDTLQVEAAQASVCLTCDHHGSSCLYNFIKMSPSTRHYIFQCDGPDVPRTELRSTAHFHFEPSNTLDSMDKLSTNDIVGKRQSPDDSLLWTIEDNQDLRNKLENIKAMPLTVRLKIPIQNTSYMADVLLLLPPQMGPATTLRATSSLAAAQRRQPQAAPISSPPGAARSRREISQPRVSISHEPPIVQKSQFAADAGRYEKPRARNLFENLDYEAIKEYSAQLPTGQQYPMVVDVYGGPGSQKVDYRFHLYFGHYLASNRRTVYAMIDGRGSGNQGSKRLHELYHKLGTVEIQDQIDTTAQLTKLLPFVDASKVAIWGWSYGGYAAAMALAQSNARALETIQAHIRSLRGQASLFATTSAPLKGGEQHRARSDSPVQAPLKFQQQNQAAPTTTPLLHSLRGVFECAASVAPVTNWIYYDTAYTERYMSSPWANELYDQFVSRDHLLQKPSQDSSLVARQQNLRAQQQRAQLLASNRWTHLNHSSLETLNSLAGRPSQSLMDLLARSSPNLPQQQQQQQQQQYQTNFTSQQAANGLKLKPNAAQQLKSPMYNELNERYRRASLLDQIGNIDRKRFLLIHGTADDNVHFQHSIMLMKQLIRRNILFETRLYPDQDHSIANRADKLHLGSTLSNFFAECFDMAY